MVLIQQKYCNNDSCLYHTECESCTSEIIVDRTYADTIKVILPDGYTQRFWVDITDQQAIEKCMKMKEQGIK
jgi:hypothetical protein